MRATYGTLGSRHTRLVFLGAVLMGCVFSLPGHAVAAGLTVEIIKPTALPSFTFDTGTEYDFEAVSFAEGQELAGGEVTWEWDFGDGNAHVLTNLCQHTFANPGNWVVTVTARYGALDGQDTLNAAAFPIGVAASVTIEPASGTVSDSVHIACRYPAFQFLGFSLREVQFSRLVGDQWLPVSSQTPVNQVQIGNTTYSEAGFPWDSLGTHNTQTARFRVKYRLERDSALNPDPVTGTKELALTPCNTVVKATPAGVILHHKGDTKHTISWDISHLPCDPAVYWALRVQVLDLSGNEVASHTAVCGSGAGSWDWEPTFAGTDQDANGLYTYRVTAGGHGGGPWDAPDQMPCKDCDKADSPALHVDSFTASLDVPTMKATFTLHYHASGGDVDEAKAEIYNPALASIAEVGLGTSGTIPKDTPLTAVAEVTLNPAGPWGTFRVVMEGVQTFEEGLVNRDQLPKPVVPKGAAQEIWPTAYDNNNQDGLLGTWDVAASHEAASCQNGCRDGQAYPATIGPDDLSGFRRSAERAALIQTCGHGDAGYIAISPEHFLTTAAIVGAPKVPGYDLQHVVLALCPNCCTADRPDPEDAEGPSIIEAIYGAGAGCVVGWHGAHNEFGAPAFAKSFWESMCWLGLPVGAAALVGADHAVICGGLDLRWYDYEILGACATILPPRYK